MRAIHCSKLGTQSNSKQQPCSVVQSNSSPLSDSSNHSSLNSSVNLSFLVSSCVGSDKFEFCGQYSFLNCWLTLLVVLQSDHQSSSVWSLAERTQCRPFSLDHEQVIESVTLHVHSPGIVFRTFNEENICSTLLFENSKLNDSLHRLRMLGHFQASAQEYNLYQTVRYWVQLMSKYIRAYSTTSSTSSCRVTSDTPLALRGILKCAAICSIASLTSAKLYSSSASSSSSLSGARDGFADVWVSK